MAIVDLMILNALKIHSFSFSNEIENSSAPVITRRITHCDNHNYTHQIDYIKWIQEQIENHHKCCPYIRCVCVEMKAQTFLAIVHLNTNRCRLWNENDAGTKFVCDNVIAKIKKITWIMSYKETFYSIQRGPIVTARSKAMQTQLFMSRNMISRLKRSSS